MAVVREDDLDENGHLLLDEEVSDVSSETISEPRDTLSTFDAFNGGGKLHKRAASNCGSVISVETVSLELFVES